MMFFTAVFPQDERALLAALYFVPMALTPPRLSHDAGEPREKDSLSLLLTTGRWEREQQKVHPKKRYINQNAQELKPSGEF